jgi:PAS domain S-box-containing protein
MVHSAPASGVVDLRDDAAAASVEAALATAVGDDSLRVAYWLDADQAWVETDGGRHDPAGRPGERAATVVERDGARLALIDHAAGVGADALDAAVHALAQGIDREREVAALRARIRDLEATEQRLLDVFEGIEVMVVSMDMDARMTYVNPFTERLSGWSREELLGANWFTTFRSGRESFLERVREGEFPPHDESTIILRNGDRRQIHWTNVALRDEGGRIIGVLGIGHDMTEQLRALRSLEAAERRMLDVFETVQLIVGQIDLEGRLTYVNEHLVRLSGWTREELLGRNYLDVFQTGSEAFLEQVQRGDFPAHDASSIQVRSGERRDIDWANVGLYDDHSKLSGVVGIGRDVTDQRKAEREAHELAAEHEALERVATEVARGVGEDAVFPLVAEQAGRLVAADGCTLLRFEPGEQARILANWSEIATDPVTPEGMVVLVSVGAAMAATYRSGRPERSDEPQDSPGRPNPIGIEEPIRSAVAAPITVGGRMWGTLVAWRVSEEPLPPDTERRLGAFASLAGTAIANADARTALAESRKRIVAAADEARRRLERNLHDGAQQRFVSLSLALRLTQALLERDPEAAAEQLRSAQAELAQGLEELRELARGIHPAILTERGLRAAVDGLVARTRVPVHVAEIPDCRLQADVEAAAYYVIAEALTNVARYAGADGATVSVRLQEGIVDVEVRDDGRGGADAGGGSGLRGLADRVEAIGGSLEVESPPGGGTLVRARLRCADCAGDPS